MTQLFLGEGFEPKKRTPKKKKISKPLELEYHVSEKNKEIGLSHPLKPSQKHLKKWKILLERYGEDKSFQIINFCFDNFEELSKKFKWYSVNADVILGFSNTIIGMIETGKSINNFSSSDRVNTDFEDSTSLGW